MKKIGVFDSGMGWLQTLKDLRAIHPEYDYVFVGDTKNNPYGEKTWKQIRDFTFSGLDYMFDCLDVGLVILACNTASAFAVRDWQAIHPDKKVLSVTIPGIEAMVGKKHDRIGVLVTEATMNSGVYPYLFCRLGGRQKTIVDVVAAPKIVWAIESGLKDTQERKKILQEYLNKFVEPIDSLVLGCTHYPIWINEVRELFSGDIIDPGQEAALAMISYFFRHPEIETTLSKQSSVSFYVTGDPDEFALPAQNLWWASIAVNVIDFWTKKS